MTNKNLKQAIGAFLVFCLLVSPGQGGEATKKAFLKIEGMTWVFCGAAVQGLLTKLHGIKKADVDWEKGEVIVEYDPSRVTTAQMAQAVNQSGVFKVEAIEDLSVQKPGHGQGGKRWKLAVSSSTRELPRHVQWTARRVSQWDE